MLKEILSSLFWGAVLFVVQIGLDLVKHEPIDWQTTVLASVMLVAIHFFVSRGRTTIEDTSKKTGVNEVTKKSVSERAKGKINHANQKQGSVSDATAMNQRGYSAEDLKFYLYNRNAKLSGIAGIICLLIWFLNSRAWFLYVGIAFFCLAVVYYILYIFKRNEFVEKQRKEKVSK